MDEMLKSRATDAEERKVIAANIRALAQASAPDELGPESEAALVNPFPGILRGGPSGTIGG